ncbi:MAG: hypothetical protein DRI26_00735 [Chloroflexi bacterium]|nr:MAG: hypothetical protein DRI26_00735 [Chloroflexota bacterium]
MIKENEKLLNDYLSGRRLSQSSREGYLKAVKNFEQFIGKAVEKADASDFSEWFKRLSRKTYKSKTIWNYGLCLKHLYIYSLEARGLSEDEANLEANKAFKGVPFGDLIKEARRESSDRDKLVTQEELNTLLKTAIHPRVKAIIAVLYESACRKGEILSLRIRDVSFGDTFTEIRVKGKTGERTIPLMFSVPYLRAWLQIHPDRRPEAPLFCSVVKGRVKPLGSSALGMALRLICEKAGIRHIHPHMLRHTRLTELAKSGLGEYQLKSFAGWTPDSRMAARYIHLAGRSHVAAVLEAQGVPIEKIKAEKPQPLLRSEACPNCGGQVGPDMLFCPNCGYILDDTMRGDLQDRREKAQAQLMREVVALKEQMRRLIERLEGAEAQTSSLKDRPKGGSPTAWR